MTDLPDPSNHETRGTPIFRGSRTQAPAFYEERIRLLQAENQRLRQALEAITEVASVAHNGDPWYCENEGVDAERAFRLVQTALSETLSHHD